MWNLPNVISACRLASVPVLLALAWRGHPKLFLILFLTALASDALDGLLARRLDQRTELGAHLDSWGDFALYLAFPWGAWWLWPEILLREAPYIATILLSYTAAAAVGFLKFRRLTSYHTWGAKVSAVAVGASALVLFAGGPAPPFHAAAFIALLAEIEEVLITLLSARPRSDVKSLWHVWSRRSWERLEG